METGTPGKTLPPQQRDLRSRPEISRWLVFSGILIALVIGAGWWITANSEPKYRGVTLSKWLQIYMNNVDAEQQRKEAELAVKQIGTNAIPTFLKWLSTTNSPTQIKLQGLLERQRFIKFRFIDDSEYHRCASVGFGLLGTNAVSAIPKIEKLLPRSEVAQEAANILCGFGKAAQPALIRALTSNDPKVRRVAAFEMYERTFDEEFGSIDTLSEMLLPVPLLLTLVDDTDSGIRSLAERQIGEAAREGVIDPTMAVPVLIKGLKYPAGRGRPAAALALAAIGVPAKSAIPALLNVLAEDATDSSQSDVDYRDALIALKAVNAPPSEVVPLLEKFLGSADPIARYWAIDNLGKYGTDAKEAVPAVLKSAEGVDNLRDDALDALKKIDSDAFARLGGFEASEGGIIRGPKNEKSIALVFTAHTFAEGGDKILDELAKHHAKGSFFVTGDFLDNPNFQTLARRIVKEGHYLGPHSDKHLLYCPWDGPKKTLVTHEEFEADLNRNLDKITRLGIPRSKVNYWLPAYEWYNRDIVDWSKAMGLTLVNFTPGTRSNADYLEDDAKNFISSRAIFESIERKEQTGPHGLNGYLLLTHLGVGPKRTDKLGDHFGELLDYLAGKGYQFVRVDELLKTK